MTGVNTRASDRIVHPALKAQALIPTSSAPSEQRGAL